METWKLWHISQSHGLNVCGSPPTPPPPPNPHVETLTPRVMVLEGKTFGWWLGLDKVMRVGPSWWDWCPCKRHQRDYSCSLSTTWGGQEEPHHNQILISDFQPPEPAINVCFLSHPVYDTFSWQPEPRQPSYQATLAWWSWPTVVNCTGTRIMQNEPHIS